MYMYNLYCTLVDTVNYGEIKICLSINKKFQDIHIIYI